MPSKRVGSSARSSWSRGSGYNHRANALEAGGVVCAEQMGSSSIPGVLVLMPSKRAGSSARCDRCRLIPVADTC